MDVRPTYLAAAAIAVDLLRDPAVASVWDRPSALSHWQVSGLAGHLARAVTMVEQYLDGDPSPRDERFTPGEYFARVVDTSDLDAGLHRTIRRRGDEMAAEGHEALVDRVGEALRELAQRLGRESPGRKVAVLAGLVLSLDDYLATRIVELVVHTDDLAVSVGRPTPEFPSGAVRLAVDTLIDTARARHGYLPVIRALTRRERDAVEALRVF